VIGSVVQGLYSVTDIGNAAGQAVYGVERWTQKNENAPGGSSFLPSIPVGAGIVVQSFEDDPIRFATELLVMDRAGKIPGKMKAKAVGTYAKAKPGISKMMKDETAQVNLRGSDYGKRAVDRWDKLAAKKAKDEPSFELVEDSNGNLVLKEVQVKNPSVKKETTHTPSDREVSTGNGQKMVMLTKSETMLETLSKMEPVEVWDLSTVTKPRIETKISQFKASQKAGIAREKMKSHKLKLKEEPKIEIKNRLAGRKNVTPKQKSTQSQKNAAKRKQVDTIEEITDTTKLEKVKKDIKIMQLTKEEIVAKKIKVQRKKQATSTDTVTKTNAKLKTESIQKVSPKPKAKSKLKTEITQKVLQKPKTKQLYMPVIVSVPRVAYAPAVVPFVQNDAIQDVAAMDDAMEQPVVFSTPVVAKTDTTGDSKTDTITDIKPDAEDRVPPKPEPTPKVKEPPIPKRIVVPKKKVILPYPSKKKTHSSVVYVPDISDIRAHRVIKNQLGNMESFFGGSTTKKKTTKKTPTKKRTTKRRTK
jgi:hypothetical protein